MVLITIAIIVLLFALYLTPFLYFEYRDTGLWGVAAIIVIYAMAFTLRRSLKRRGNTITLSLGQAPAPRLYEDVRGQRRILSMLVARGALESAFRERTVAMPAEGDVRAAQLRRLREDGLWDDLALPVRDTLSAPEGSWTAEVAGRCLQAVEIVRVLSWFVTESAVLGSLRSAIADAQNAIRELIPQTLVREAAAPPAFLRTELEIGAQQAPAMAYLSRVHNELVKRGVKEGTFDESMGPQLAGYMQYAASVGEAEVVAEDLPVGTLLVAESSTEDLQYIMGLAASRYLALEMLRITLAERSAKTLTAQIAALVEGKVVVQFLPTTA